VTFLHTLNWLTVGTFYRPPDCYEEGEVAHDEEEKWMNFHRLIICNCEMMSLGTNLYQVNKFTNISGT